MSRSVRNILRNSALQTVNVYAVTVLNFLLILAYTRALGPEQFGVLATSQAQVLVWVMLVDLGLYGGLVSALTAAEADKSDISRQGFRAWDLVWRVLGIRMGGAVLGTTFITILAYFHAKHDGSWNAQVFWRDVAFVPHLYALAFQQTFTAYVNFRGRFKMAVIGNVTGVAISAGLSAYLAHKGAPIPLLLVAQSWGGFVAGFIILFSLWWQPIHEEPTRRTQRTRSGSWRQEAWQALFRDAWPYALIFAASVLWQRLDQIVASHFLSFEAGGQYALAVRLMAIPMMVANAIYIAIVPDIQRVGRDAPEKLIVYVGSVGKILFRYGLPVAFVLLYLIRELMLPLFPKFHAARDLLFWFAPGIWGYWIQNFLVAALYGLRSFREVVWVHFGALLVYVVSLLVLVQAFGLVGVVMGYDIFCLSLAYFALRALKKAKHLEAGFFFHQKFSLKEREFIDLVKTRIPGLGLKST